MRRAGAHMLLRSLLLASIVLPLTSCVGALVSRPQPGDVIFFDDFSAATLDRSKWNVVVTGFWVNNEQQAYIDSESTLYIAHGSDAGGAENALVIQPRYRPGFTTKEGRKFDFVSGRINTRDKMEFTYGTVAARMKLPVGQGFWPAFWALGDGRWPDTGEIDIMENVGESDWVSAAMHGPNYSGATPLVNKLYLPADSDVSAWHVYSVDWTRDSLIFKVDDRVMFRVTRAMVEHYGRWAFDNRKFLILNLALGGAFPSAVNGVEEPYPGIPQSTVDLIRSNDARVLVDWVRVTRN